MMHPLIHDWNHTDAPRPYAVLLDDESMLSDNDFRRGRHTLAATEDRDFDIDQMHFRFADRGKPRINGTGESRALGNRMHKRVVLLEMTDAPTQLACDVQADKSCRTPRKFPFRVRLHLRYSRNSGKNRPSRHFEEQLLIGCRDHAALMAAAMYPTTDDLSPDTSPESA